MLIKGVAELLETRRFPALSQALRERVDSIMRQWEQAVRHALPAANRLNVEQLRDHLPLVLRVLADVLGADVPRQNSRLEEEPVQHGIDRFDQDFNIQELIIEYRLLRRIAFEEAASGLGRPLETDEALALHMGIDSLMQESVVSFVQHQKRQIESAVAGEAKFLSFISHDLRNSLNNITLTLSLLVRRLQGRPEFAEDVVDLENVRQSIMETIGAMERLLQAERLRRQPQIKLSTVDLRMLGQELHKRFSPQAGKKGLGLDVDIPPGAALQTDREWLAMVLQNLVGNAVKYSQQGVVRVVAEPRPDGGWSIAVSDQGPGIAPEHRARLFTAFERGDARGQKGFGLGLVIVAEAMRMLGGEVAVDSQPGAGSTFRITLPPRPPQSCT
jgi:signal transduction histidine kinase